MKRITCIVCPNGCRIDCEEVDGAWRCSGNACKRGAAYAVAELTAPMRTLTTTVRTQSAQMPALPVRTRGELPKARLSDAVAALAGVTVQPPLHIGDVVLPNILGLGCDVIATADLTPERGKAPRSLAQDNQTGGNSHVASLSQL